MIKGIFNSKSKTIASAAIILGAASLVSRLLGLVRDRILAGTFGAGDELDIYYAAFRIPDLVFSLLVVGAISAGFIPVFVSYLNKDKEKSWHLANSVLNIMVLALVVASGILIIFTPWLMKLLAPGFSPEKLALTIPLSRVMFLSPLFLALSAVFGGILQSFRRFLAYSLGPIMYNLGIIFGVLFFIKPFGLIGLAYGVVLGSFLHALIQIPTAYLCGFRWQPVFDFKFEGVKRIFKMMPPRIVNLSLYQITTLVITFIASFLAVGSIAIFSLAYNILSFPLGIFGVSFTIASFPRLSESAQEKDKDSFVKTFSATLRQILFFVLPSSVILIVLRTQIIQVIFGTGRFGKEDIIITAQTMAYLSISLFAQSLIPLFMRGFFAWEDTKTPLLTSFLATLIVIPLAWYWSLSLGVVGLALAITVSSIFHLILLFIFLKKKIGFLDLGNILSSTSKILIASLSAGLVIYGSLIVLTPNGTNLNIFLQSLLAGVIGILIYFLFVWIFKLEELKVFVSALINRLPWKRMPRDIEGIGNK